MRQHILEVLRVRHVGPIGELMWELPPLEFRLGLVGLGASRRLRTHSRTNLVAFAESGAQALQMMALQPFDVVISDLVMPGMDGAQLLSEVMHQYPQSTRIVLCGNADQPLLARLYGIAHQYLFKPCNPTTLENVLNSLFSRSGVLQDQKVKKLISQVKNIPSLPTLYLDLQREMQSDDASLEKAGDIVSRDPGMASKQLQLVNSAHFGLARKVTTPQEAVLYLGIETIKSIVVVAATFFALRPRPNPVLQSGFALGT